MCGDLPPCLSRHSHTRTHQDVCNGSQLKAEATGYKYFTGKSSDEMADVYQADNFVVTEKGNKTTIREVDDPDRPGYRENQIEIEVDPETGGVTYNEASARPDMDGKLKDVDEYIEDDVTTASVRFI